MRSWLIIVVVVITAALAGWGLMRVTEAPDELDSAEVGSTLTDLAAALRLDERIEWQVIPDIRSASAVMPSTVRYRKPIQFWRRGFGAERGRRQ